MIASAVGVDTSLLVVFVCWSLACWVLGVSYAAYRAVSWVDRMRTWAHTTTITTTED